MNFLDILLCIAAGLTALPCLYLLALTLLSARVPTPPLKTSSLRFDILVPSHNEEAGIARTIENLRKQAWPKQQFRVIVVADNCTDNTALLAQQAGATVWERHSETERGKGYALEFAFQKSLKEGFAEAVVVVDADSLLSENTLKAFAARIQLGAMAMQAHYGVLEINSTWRTRLMRIAFATFHGVRSLARERLGLSCGLRGNGMCFVSALIREVPHRAHSVVEDLEYGVLLGRAGYRVFYASEAEVLGEMTGNEKASRSQRQRWEGGRLALMKSMGLPLLWQGIRHAKPLWVDLALDVLVPPLSWLVLCNLGGLLVALMLGLWEGYWPASTFAFSGAVFCLLLYVLRGWQLSKAGLRGLLDLACAPWFVAWKLALTLTGRNKSPKTWVRTQREMENTPPNKPPEEPPPTPPSSPRPPGPPPAPPGPPPAPPGPPPAPPGSPPAPPTEKFGEFETRIQPLGTLLAQPPPNAVSSTLSLPKEKPSTEMFGVANVPTPPLLPKEKPSTEIFGVANVPTPLPLPKEKPSTEMFGESVAQRPEELVTRIKPLSAIFAKSHRSAAAAAPTPTGEPPQPHGRSRTEGEEKTRVNISAHTFKPEAASPAAHAERTVVKHFNEVGRRAHNPQEAFPSFSLEPAKAPKARSPVWRFVFRASLVLGLVSMTALMAAFGNGSLLVTALPTVVFILAILLFRLPLRTSTLCLLFLMLVCDYLPEGPHSGLWASPLAPIANLLFLNLSASTGISLLRLTGLDAAVILLLFVGIWRRAFRVEHLDPPGTPSVRQLNFLLVLQFAVVLALDVWGVATGGDFNEALWQLRQMLLFPVMGFFFLHAIPGRTEDFRLIARVIVAAAVVKSIIGVYFMRAIVWPNGWEVEFTTSHSDTLLFVPVLTMAVALVFERPIAKTLWHLPLWVPIVFLGMKYNDRRLAYVALVISIITVLVMLPWSRIKRSAFQALVVLSPIFSLYVAVGWKADALHHNPIWGPAQMIKSLIKGDPNQTGADYRDMENFNVLYTWSENAILPLGFGHRFQEPIVLPDISFIMPTYQFHPHNTILWMWTIGGLFGFTAMFLPVVALIFFAARSYPRTLHPVDRTAIFTALSFVITYLAQCWGDMGTRSYFGSMGLALSLTVISKLAVRSGAWPAPHKHPLA